MDSGSLVDLMAECFSEYRRAAEQTVGLVH